MEKYTYPWLCYNKKDRNRHGGGVALYIKNILSYSVTEDFVTARLEIVCVEINPPESRTEKLQFLSKAYL